MNQYPHRQALRTARRVKTLLAFILTILVLFAAYRGF